MTEGLERPTRDRRSPRWLPLLGILLLSVLLWRIDVTTVLSSISSANLRLVALAATIFGLNILVKIVRWKRILELLSMDISWRVAATEFLVSVFYGSVTPGRVGEVMRGEILVRKGYPLGVCAVATLFDRVLDLIALILVGLVMGLPWWIGISMGASARSMIPLAAAALLILAGGLLSRLGTAPLACRFPRFAPFVEAVSVLLRPRQLTELVAWTGLAAICYFGTIVAVASALGLPATPGQVIAAMAVATLVGLIPVTFQGLGTREAVLIFILAEAGVSSAQSVSLGLAVFAVFFVTSVAGGLLGLQLRRRQDKV